MAEMGSIKVQLSSQDRTILRNITRAINGLTLALNKSEGVNPEGDSLTEPEEP